MSMGVSEKKKKRWSYKYYKQKATNMLIVLDVINTMETNLSERLHVLSMTKEIWDTIEQEQHKISH